MQMPTLTGNDFSKMRDHKHVQHRGNEKHDRRYRPEEQERDIGRLAAITCLGQLVARGFLRQPFSEVEVLHHLGDDLFRRLPQRHFFGLVETLALPRPDPLTLAGDRLHAFGQPFAREQRHDQRIGRGADRDSGKQHGHEMGIVNLFDQKTNHAAPLEVEVDHFFHDEDAYRHPDHAADQHQLAGRMRPQ